MRLHLCAAVLVALTSCAEEAPLDPEGTDPTPTTDEEVAGAKDKPHHYVTSTVTVPTTAAQATALGFDLDGDGVADNALGKMIAALSGQLDVAGAAQSALTDGSVVILHSMRSTGYTKDKSVQWQVYLGDPEAAPDLTSGKGKFTIAATSPRDAVLAGAIVAKAFAGGPGQIALSFAPAAGSAPVTVHIVAAHVAAGVAAAHCTSGRLGGAIPMTDVNDAILPTIAAALDAHLAADGCTASAGACTSSDRTILSLLDTNGDRVVSADELRGSSLVQALLKPDVDVLGADGEPGQDGVKDSISLAIGFTCTAAQFVE